MREGSLTVTAPSYLCKFLGILCLLTLLAGCKLAVIVSIGGDVKSSSGVRNCNGGDICVVEVTAPFNDTFTATAKPGNRFVRWQKGNGFLCGGSTAPTCVVTVPGDANGVALAASSNLGYLQPIFCTDTDGDLACNDVDSDDDNDGFLDSVDRCPLLGPSADGFGCPRRPITGNAFANGKTWAQPDLFVGLFWDNIAAVCPAPAGACIGTLNGYDMRGWTWASASDVKQMFTAVTGMPCSGDPCIAQLSGYIASPGDVWTAKLSAAGFRVPQLNRAVKQLGGFVRGKRERFSMLQSKCIISIDTFRCTPNYWSQTWVSGWTKAEGPTYYDNSRGAWMYRSDTTSAQ
jgi:hypothetical protein